MKLIRHMIQYTQSDDGIQSLSLRPRSLGNQTIYAIPYSTIPSTDLRSHISSIIIFSKAYFLCPLPPKIAQLKILQHELYIRSDGLSAWKHLHTITISSEYSLLPVDLQQSLAHLPSCVIIPTLSLVVMMHHVLDFLTGSVLLIFRLRPGLELSGN